MIMDGSVEAFYQRTIAQLVRTRLGTTLMHVGFHQVLDGLLRSGQAMFTKGRSCSRSSGDYLCHALKAEDTEEPAAPIMATFYPPYLTSTSRTTREVLDSGRMAI